MDSYSGKRTQDGKWGQVGTLIGHTDIVVDVAFTPDGSRIGTCSADGTARIWDVFNGKQLVLLSGHKKRANRLSFSLNDTRIATLDGEGTVRIWNSETGDEIFRRKLKKANSVYFSTDGSRLLASNKLGVYSWPINES